MPFSVPDDPKTTGTFIEDVHVDELVRCVYPGDYGLTVGFTAPVFDGSAKLVALWSDRATGVVSAISAASDEQAQGIQQINSAVHQLERVTQQNAAAAEESASASEQMNHQADELTENVEALILAVNGARWK
ncbi:MAG: hypothetical protein IPG71_10175 [bacterium]|nr:hypothetical protein [bacterium]